MGRFIVDDGSAGITQSKLGLTVFGGLSTQGGLSATCADGEEIYLNGNVGIGTNAPAASLEVYDATNSQIRVKQSGSTNYSLWEHTTSGPVNFGTVGTQDLNFQTGNSVRMTVDDGGNVGIGGVNPDALLHLFGTTSAGEQAVLKVGSTASGYGHIGYNVTGSKFWMSPTATASAGITMDSTGVGIGTASPAKLLDISGDTASMRFTETGTGARTWEVGRGVASNGAFTIYDVTGGGGRLTVNTTGAIGWGDSAGSGNLSYGDDKANVYATTDKRLHFGASNSDTHLIIETNGNIGIGTQHASRALDIGPKTDGMVIPIGSTAQRPATYLSAGTIRFNSELAAFEGYTGSAWGALGGGNAFDGASIIRYNTQTLGENVTIGIPGSLSANG